VDTVRIVLRGGLAEEHKQSMPKFQAVPSTEKEKPASAPAA